MTPLRIGFVGYEQANALDLAGPTEAFASAFREDGKGKRERCYEIAIIGLTKRPFVTESGLVFVPATTLAAAPKLDTVIVPGGCGLRRPEVNRKVADWILQRAKSTRRVASVCTGIYGLAATGLLDGRNVTTHWRFAADVARQFPALKMKPNALFVKDGPFYTAAGVTAGIDLALALIERFAELVTWMTNNPTAAMSVEDLARRASLSPRQFFRRFKEHFGSSPAAFVETLRLNEARRRLTAGEPSIDTVAESVGFNGVDSFRRAFARRFRVTPSKFRRNFALPDASSRRSKPRNKRK
jgi:transcriptional regulator GlxA family with amidase domain